MKFIIIVKNRLENIYKKFPRIIGYVGRLAFAVCSLLLLRVNCGYNEKLTNIWIVLILSVFCAFAPMKLMALIISVYLIIQMCSLSLGVGVVCTVIILAVYLVYFRFDTKYLYFLFLIPFFAMARLPLLIPLILAVTASLDTIALVLFGYLIYFMIRCANLNAAVINSMTNQSEYYKMSYTANGIFTNTEFLYTLIILTIVFLLVYYLKKININQANNFAIFAGTGLYIIASIIANLLFMTLTSSRLIIMIAGAIVSGLLAAVIVYGILPLDYTRLETFEFEDEEYHYYVRAVPKAVIKKESVKVKKINSRREVHSKKEREH